ncbi:WD40 repeat domain-containing protein [bacterium]|nr:WD40 repeat domain-containing protein [bacterium]
MISSYFRFRNLFISIVIFGFLNVPFSLYHARVGYVVVAQDNLFLSEIEHLGRGIVNGIAWSPDSQSLAVATDIGIWIYGATLTDKIHLEYQNDRIIDLDWLADSSQVIAISSNGRIITWNIGDNAAQVIALQSEGELRHISMNPNGTLFATAIRTINAETQIQIWNFATRELIQSISLGNIPITELSWNRTGNLLGAGTFSNEVLLWSADDNWQPMPLEIDGVSGETIEWSSSNDNLLMINSEFGQLLVVDVITQEILDVFETMNIDNFVWRDEDNLVIYVQSINGALSIFPTGSQQSTETLFGNHLSSSLLIDASANGHYLANYTSEGELIVWGLEAPAIIATQPQHYQRINLIAGTSINGDLAFLSGKCVYIWNVVAEDITFDREHLCYEINSLSWHPNQEILAIGGIAGVQIWNLINDTFSFFDVQDPQGSLAWSIDGNEILINSQVDQNIAIRQITIDSGRFTSLETDLQDFNADIFTLDTRREQLGVVAGDASITVWDLSQEQLITVFKSDGQRGIIGDFDANNIAWSPDGNQIAVLTYSNQLQTVVQVWDLNTSEPVNITGNGKIILSVSWNDDGSLLFTGNQDGSIDVWDSATLDLVTRIQAHNDAVHTLSWLPAEDHLVSGSADGTIKYWQLAR